MDQIIKNVTCTNPACTQPLFALLRSEDGKIGLKSFGAIGRKQSSSPDSDLAVCPHCGTVTPLGFKLPG